MMKKCKIFIDIKRYGCYIKNTALQIKPKENRHRKIHLKLNESVLYCLLSYEEIIWRGGEIFSFIWKKWKIILKRRVFLAISTSFSFASSNFHSNLNNSQFQSFRQEHRRKIIRRHSLKPQVRMNCIFIHFSIYWLETMLIFT